MRTGLVGILLSLAFLAAVRSADAAAPVSEQVMVGVTHTMEATLYTPDGHGPFPTILLLHTSGGLTGADLQYCSNLAMKGYICLAPAFLRAYGITEAGRRQSFTKDRRAITEDFIATIEMLNRLPKAKPGAVGAIGFSNGGYFALQLAALRKVKAGVSYYGALDGARTQPNLTLFQKLFTRDSAPVLVLAGENDSTVGMAPVLKLEQILKAAGAPYELKLYPYTEHAFDRSTKAPGNQAAANDAWSRTLAFFATHLK